MTYYICKAHPHYHIFTDDRITSSGDEDLRSLLSRIEAEGFYNATWEFDEDHYHLGYVRNGTYIYNRQGNKVHHEPFAQILFAVDSLTDLPARYPEHFI